MSIIVVCQCGQRFSAEDKLLGKRVQCPKCRVVLTIRPGPAAAPGEMPSASPAGHGQSGADVPWLADVTPAGAKPVPGKPAKSPAASEARGWIVLDTGLTICFASLIAGGAAFAVLTIAGLALMTGPDLSSLLTGGSGGNFVGILMLWSTLIWLGSFVALATGWRVCWAVPKETKAQPMIRAALGCVGAALGTILLLQLLGLAMAASTSGISSAPPRRNAAEIKKYEEDVARARKDRESNAKIMGYVGNAFVWLSMLASLASTAAFALFLGLLGEYLGAAKWKQLATYFCMLQGAFAVWLTLSMCFEGSSPTFMRFCMILTMLFILASYAGLIYLAHTTRRLVAEQA